MNSTTLTGYVGGNPIVKEINGTKVANFSLATTERGYTTSNGTIVPDRTDWFNIVCWGAKANLVENFLKKGDRILVQGTLRSNQYTDSNNNKQYRVEIQLETIEFLNSKPAPAPAAKPKPKAKK